MPKTTKSQLMTETDAFFYTLDWFTGGTKAERVRRLDAGKVQLQAKADKVTELLKNPNAHCIKDKWLMERAESLVGRVERYVDVTLQFEQDLIEDEKERKAFDAELATCEASEAPTNIIQFPTK